MDSENEKGLITLRIQSILDAMKVFGTREFTIEVPEGSTVRELLEILVNDWGEKLAELIYRPGTSDPARHIQLIVNSRNIVLLDNLETVLKHNDVFLIFPPAGGG